METYTDFFLLGFSANNRCFSTRPCNTIRKPLVPPPGTFIPNPFGSSGTLKDIP